MSPGQTNIVGKAQLLSWVSETLHEEIDTWSALRDG
ncbi:hypothetical protein KIPB_012255, partial [Kipferlia bialata]|eukprot:g12255.t1